MIDRRDFLRTGMSATMGSLLLRGHLTGSTVNGKEYHVSVRGNDQNDGSRSHMLRTISEAAKRAQPGDVITVHRGIYRERVDPPRGGVSPEMPITYQAAPGELVEITGAEMVTGWKKVKDDVWTLALPNSFFGAFNPYADLIHGDWFNPLGRQHHTGAVYLNGEWFAEAASMDQMYAVKSGTPLWFGQVDTDKTTLWAQFRRVDPNTQLTEINVRQSVFYPSKTGIDFITVRGFTLRRAATPWAPPTAEQIGLIGTNWSKGWVIEHNIISHSVCSGISLGKYGDEFDNTSANSAEGYVATIKRALTRGWSSEHIGHHLVRANEISHCEQAGIVGSLGCAFSQVIGNTVHHIHVRKLFSGAEMSGIKFHGAVDAEISQNNVYHSYRGLWLDWLAQGTHVHRNVFHDNEEADLFLEVDHGPFLVDHNLLLSRASLFMLSQGGAFAHNLLAGGLWLKQYDARLTPYLKAHATEIAGLHDNPSGDMRFYNNLFVQGGDVSPYDEARLPIHFAGNVFLDTAQPTHQEASPLVDRDFESGMSLVPTAKGWQFDITLDPTWSIDQTRQLVTTTLLGNATIPDLPFVQADDTPFTLDRDYSGQLRNATNPFPGPFEPSQKGERPQRVRFLVP